MNSDEIKTKLKLKKLAYSQLFQGADDLLEDGALFWTERLLLKLVRHLASVRMQQVGDVLPADGEGTAVRVVKEALLEAMAEAALGGHDLGEWEEVENGWQARCGRCGQTTWIGENGLRYGLLEEQCCTNQLLSAQTRHDVNIPLCQVDTVVNCRTSGHHERNLTSIPVENWARNFHDILVYYNNR
ncbi:MAG: hypothetical protein IPG51_00825 [Chloroflexi bacterium]|nr:hypothetical protein [Chloroflexota bacterium]